MHRLLEALRSRVAQSYAPLTPTEYNTLLDRAVFLHEDDQEDLALEVLGVALRARRKFGRGTGPLVEQLIDISDKLLGAVEAA